MRSVADDLRQELEDEVNALPLEERLALILRLGERDLELYAQANGLDRDSAISLDNVVTVPVGLLGRTVGYLSAAQEVELARAVVLAYDLDLPLLT